jgi:hypothetical protein
MRISQNVRHPCRGWQGQRKMYLTCVNEKIKLYSSINRIEITDRNFHGYEQVNGICDKF